MLTDSRQGMRGVTLYGNGEAVAVSYSSSTGSKSVYLGKDLLGSVRTATADGVAIEDRYEYDAFGKPYSGDLSGAMNLGYTGKPYDTATGLYNYGYRDYSPQAARFTTVDPVRDGSNWFAYVNNDPVNWIDLWGLWDYRVHRNMTFNSAIETGFSPEQAGIIAMFNNRVDALFSGTDPIFGDQSWHFNTNPANGKLGDSRQDHADEQMEKAVELYNSGKTTQALAELGKGLHALQDMDAHANEYVGKTVILPTGEELLSHANVNIPLIAKSNVPPIAGEADNIRYDEARYEHTKDATNDYLQEFRNKVGLKSK